MIETRELQDKLKVDTYIEKAIIINFLDGTKIHGKLLAISKNYFLLDLMDEGFIEIIIFKDTIKYFYEYEI